MTDWEYIILIGQILTSTNTNDNKIKNIKIIYKDWLKEKNKLIEGKK